MMTSHPSLPKGQWYEENASSCHSMFNLFIVFFFPFFHIFYGRWTITAFSFVVDTAYTLSWLCQPEASIQGWLVNLFFSLT